MELELELKELKELHREHGTKKDREQHEAEIARLNKELRNLQNQGGSGAASGAAEDPSLRKAKWKHQSTVEDEPANEGGGKQSAQKKNLPHLQSFLLKRKKQRKWEIRGNASELYGLFQIQGEK